MADDAFADLANELYELPPDEFTAARNARAKELRGSDRDLANAVGELRRPSAPAWLVNQLARHRSDELAQLLQLGEQLREAQAEVDASALVALAKERRKVVRALAQDAGELAEQLGHPVRGPVLDDVADTLQAAMTDAAASEALLTGRLTRSLEAIGTEVDLTDAVAAWSGADGSARSSRPAPHDEVGEHRAKKQRKADEAEAAKRAAEVAKAEQAASTAEDAADEASARVDDAHAAVKEAASARDELRKALTELEQRLAEAEQALAESERTAGEREQERDAAASTAEAARASADELAARD
ncbi:hypothetical protein [Agromyces sp. Leaf222]|uniref:hypothetical protein n=1 Tax=Agromyces sp. Leaf222 TaxID=1735688 RepID=UPI00070042CB|nr:hypothetical protein [Agromyces sp. Leaf222]KQM82428.1 hypothetical protein ASE68_03285 [Agromyces sp. Leaf222]